MLKNNVKDLKVLKSVFAEEGKVAVVGYDSNIDVEPTLDVIDGEYFINEDYFLYDKVNGNVYFIGITVENGKYKYTIEESFCDEDDDGIEDDYSRAIDYIKSVVDRLNSEI